MKDILQDKFVALTKEKHLIESRLSIINSIMEDNEMKYQLTKIVFCQLILFENTFRSWDNKHDMQLSC